MALQMQISFDTAQEAIDGSGWLLSRWEDDNPAVVVERFQRLRNATSLTAAVTNKALNSNVATLTTAAAHGFVVGDWVTVAIGDPVFNGSYKVVSTPTATLFTYAKVGVNVASIVSTGSAVTTKSLQERTRELWAADATLLSYFTDKANVAVIAANAGAVATAIAAYLAAEGL